MRGRKTRRTTDQQLRDRREETQSYNERGFIQEEPCQQLTHPTEKHAGAFQVGMWVPWPRGGERSGEMESTAHMLT